MQSKKKQAQIEENQAKRNAHGLKYVVYWAGASSSGLNLPQALNACRAHACGKIIAVRNTQSEVKEICKKSNAIAVTAARRNSELASNHRALFCKCVFV